ncbi:unnamed protein product [Citrullus colocynthis]|uniref:Transposase-associated domain-containing protein n=1 Tax=Citrullus colocynthis TaxID=252529 RepID=A0ABP0YFP0_9ROSI
MPGQIYCPCKRCNNAILKTRDDVEENLLMFGIVQSYTRWTMHDEESFSYEVGENDNDFDDEDVFEILEDHFSAFNKTIGLVEEFKKKEMVHESKLREIGRLEKKGQDSPLDEMEKQTNEEKRRCRGLLSDESSRGGQWAEEQRWADKTLGEQANRAAFSGARGRCV